MTGPYELPDGWSLCAWREPDQWVVQLSRNGQLADLTFQTEEGIDEYLLAELGSTYRQFVDSCGEPGLATR